MSCKNGQSDNAKLAKNYCLLVVILLSQLLINCSVTTDKSVFEVSQPKANIQLTCQKAQLYEGSVSTVNPNATECTVKISQILQKDASVQISTTGTATEIIDFSETPSQILIPAGQNQATFTVSVLNDALIEKVETITISISQTSHEQIDSETDSTSQNVTLQIVDDELKKVEAYVVTPSITLDEATPSRRLNWTIEFYDSQTGDPVSLPFDLTLKPLSQNNKINISKRLTSEMESLIVPHGSETFEFSFGIINDSEAQPYQRDFIKFQPQSDVQFSSDDTLKTELELIDEDKPTLKLVWTKRVATENGGVSSFKVVSNRSVFSTLKVDLRLSGTAIQNIDYNGGSGSPIAESLVIPAGALESPSSNLVLLKDNLYEGQESVRIDLIERTEDFWTTPNSFISFAITDDFVVTPETRSIEISAQPSPSRSSITLDWSTEGAGAAFKIYRKLTDEKEFPIIEIASIPPSVFTYEDKSITAGVKYEYKIERVPALAFGYIVSSLNPPVAHSQGGVLVVSEASVTAQLEPEISQWTQDLADDGFTVHRISVAESASALTVKSLIYQAVSQSGGVIKHVVLFGHVPVPYSGNFAPDGHSDHVGAWPADGFYADLDQSGLWTDSQVNSVVASRIQNRNIPGDGKFDNTKFPLELRIAVGRIDMKSLPAFSPLTEVELLRRYLVKNRSYRKGIVQVNKRALFDDNWGNFGGGDFFATSFWRSVSSIVPKESIMSGVNESTSDWFSQLQTNSYLFAYGGGAGYYNSVSGVATTSDFASRSSQAVFISLFGSYLGDWDSTDNILRASLAANGMGLASVWSGRPGWYFHHMAAGETIGYSALVSMNNTATYASNSFPAHVHMALLGDPTLKSSVVAPASDVRATQIDNNLKLSWKASVDSQVDGYYIYRSSSRLGPFTLVSPQLVTNLEYTTSIFSGYFMVRASKIEQGPSGSFRILSSGTTVFVAP